jgi:hypothetical protein
MFKRGFLPYRNRTLCLKSDVGADCYPRRDQCDREHLIRYHQTALAGLGLQVILTQPGGQACPPDVPEQPSTANGRHQQQPVNLNLARDLNPGATHENAPVESMLFALLLPILLP